MISTPCISEYDKAINSASAVATDSAAVVEEDIVGIGSGAAIVTNVYVATVPPVGNRLRLRRESDGMMTTKTSPTTSLKIIATRGRTIEYLIKFLLLQRSASSRFFWGASSSLSRQMASTDTPTEGNIVNYNAVYVAKSDGHRS
jgi:hypothetical protein